MVEGKVVYASSHDPNFPPSAVLDGKSDTYWVSGGLFPQQLVISMPGLATLSGIQISTYNVKSMVLERSVKNQPTDFQEVTNKELEHREGRLQESSLVSEAVPAQHLRIIIKTGYDHFCSVHRVQLSGQLHEPPASKTPKTSVTAAPSALSVPSNDVIKPDLRKTSTDSSFSQRSRTKAPPAELSSSWANDGIQNEDEDDEEEEEIEVEKDPDEIQKLTEHDDSEEEVIDNNRNLITPLNYQMSEAPPVNMMQTSALRMVQAGPVTVSQRSPSRRPGPLQVQPRQPDEFIYGMPLSEDDDD
ncbi:uncharacterized protein LOC125178123 [Hyalella azteca]|uniref:Uncharacterized protein LOC125178123 n=1 Tax=Hyalella azteca TaxID=294128 RepID=A0A979FKR4_HYAAZ|nr:uncharacterized protein LOC125178123 [Hyalella azteca]XP_047737135.1 uncharacterized protein LOC125178123 [Hyalella azteca]XP_047737136.1 uncharacterized protein LOC125178123 [Hyalella azteca]